MTKQQLIRLALQEIGVVSEGNQPTTSDLSVASDILDQWLDSTQADRLWIFAIQRMLFVPAQLKQTYTLGPGGDFNVTPRPAKVTRYGVISLNNPQQPLELPLDSLTEAQWQSIPVKGITSALPQRVWDDNQFPLRNLNLWPVPNVQVDFTVYQWAALTAWPDYVTDVQFPPGYARAIRLSLAIELGDIFGAARMVSPLMIQKAQQAVSRLKAMNAPMIDLRVDKMLQEPEHGYYNWLTDDANIGSGG